MEFLYFYFQRIDLFVLPVAITLHYISFCYKLKNQQCGCDVKFFVLGNKLAILLPPHFFASPTPSNCSRHDNDITTFGVVSKDPWNRRTSGSVEIFCRQTDIPIIGGDNMFKFQMHLFQVLYNIIKHCLHVCCVASCC